MTARLARFVIERTFEERKPRGFKDERVSQKPAHGRETPLL
jgi:hypothetical protein